MTNNTPSGVKKYRESTKPESCQHWIHLLRNPVRIDLLLWDGKLQLKHALAAKKKKHFKCNKISKKQGNKVEW